MVNLRTATRITAQLLGSTGIAVARSNGIYTISIDFSEFVPLPSVDPEDEDTTYLPFVQDTADGDYHGKISFADFATQIGATLTGTYQPVDATLTALAGVTVAANKLIYATDADAFTTADLTAAGRALLDDADASAQRTTLGLVIGTNVQAYDADLAALAANSTDGLWAHTGAGTGAARTLTAPAAGFSITNPAGIAGDPTFVLANDLSALEGLGSTGLAARTASDTWAQRTVTAGAGTSVTNGDGVSGNPTITVSYAAASTANTTATPNTGAFTGGDTAGWRYWNFGKIVYFRVTVTPTWAAAGGYITIPLPTGTAAADFTASGFNSFTATLVAGFIGSGGTTMNVFKYDGTFPQGASAQKIVVSGFYEIT